MPLSRAAPLSNRPDHLHAEGIDFEMPRNVDGPDKLASRQALAERRAQPITRIRYDTAEAHTGHGWRELFGGKLISVIHMPRGYLPILLARSDHAIDFGKRHLGLGARCPIFDRNACTLQPRRIACPTLGEKKKQRHYHWDFIAGERQ